ncbi:hypothetical protein MLD38_021862 [Melastoma candidum]|uniref:Uncharacterized protein n=1 Tax=Melastoma candidum TaxID=119954 RepID=A0ACB9QH94_9MYRT|nr:hypothetical protein MLD38_021862 [Melastoma candidum]
MCTKLRWCRSWSVTPKMRPCMEIFLAKYVDDPKNFFAVSSYFCQWGSIHTPPSLEERGLVNRRMRTQVNRSLGQGMDIIETGEPDAFKLHLMEYDNTICRLMMKNCSTKTKMKFLRYEQSSQCKSMRDSSISYASAATKLEA